MTFTDILPTVRCILPSSRGAPLTGVPSTSTQTLRSRSFSVKIGRRVGEGIEGNMNTNTNYQRGSAYSIYTCPKTKCLNRLGEYLCAQNITNPQLYVQNQRSVPSVRVPNRAEHSRQSRTKNKDEDANDEARIRTAGTVCELFESMMSCSGPS